MKKFRHVIFSVLVAVASIALSLGFVLGGQKQSAFAANGGAFYVGSGSTLTLEGKKNISGFSATNGGGVMIAGGTMEMLGGDVFGNTAENHGGGITVNNTGTLTISAGAISENEAGKRGGGICSSGTTTISGGTISSNKADLGGGIAVVRNVTTINDINITGNTATSNGGAMWVYGGEVVIKDGSFSGNSASLGGGIYVSSGTTVTISKIALTHNTASTRGGAIYVEENGTLTLNAGTIVDNAGANAVYVLGNFTMNGGLIGNNSTNNIINTDIYCADTATVELNNGRVLGGIIAHGVLKISRDFICEAGYGIGSDGTIVITDYNGTIDDEYKIYVGSNRTGSIITLEGSSTEPDLSKFKVSGFDEDKYQLSTSRNASGNWVISIVEKVATFSNTWKSELISLMSVQYVDQTLKSITIEKTAPTGYTKIGKLACGIDIYNDSTGASLSFVFPGTIYAPENCTELFASLKVKNLYLYNFDTSNTTTADYMFHSSDYLENIDMSSCDFSQVQHVASAFDFNASGIKKIKTPINCSISVYLPTSVTLYNQSTGLAITSFTTGSASMTIVSSLTGNIYLSNNWQTMIQNSTYMTTTIDPALIYTIDIASTAPSGGTLAGTLPYGVRIYYKMMSSTYYRIAFVSASVIHAPEDSSSLFASLKMLSSINFDNFDTSNAVYMNNMFFKCSALTSLDLSAFNTSNAKTMYRMFGACTSLSSITFGNNWNTSKVEDFGIMFSGCIFQELDLSKFDTSSAKNLRGMLMNLKQLKSIDLSSFNTSNVTSMENLFYDSWLLESITFGNNFDTSKVTNMQAMFNNCQSLKELDLSFFNTYNVTTMASMFCDCKGMLKLNLSSFDMTYVTDATDMFGFEALLELQTPKNSATVITITTNTTLENNGTVVTAVPATATESYTFVATNSLEINATSFKNFIIDSYSIEYFIEMTEIAFEYALIDPWLNEYNHVYTLSNGVKVYKDDAYKIRIVYNGQIKTAEDITSMFQDLTKLEKASFNNFDTSNTVIMTTMFYNCTSMKYLDLSNFDMLKTTNTDGMLEMNSDLEILKTPKAMVMGRTVSFVVNTTMYSPSGRVRTSFGYNSNGSITFTSTNPNGFIANNALKNNTKVLVELIGSLSLVCVSAISYSGLVVKKRKIK